MEATMTPMTPMTYNQIIDKINKVFDSCTNKQQAIVGERYCCMLNNKYMSNYGIIRDVIESGKLRALKEW